MIIVTAWSSFQTEDETTVVSTFISPAGETRQSNAAASTDTIDATALDTPTQEWLSTSCCYIEYIFGIITDIHSPFHRISVFYLSEDIQYNEDAHAH